jgi:hypothetical protein
VSRDWSDFEPTTDRERMAYALMVAGVVDDDVPAADAKRGLVRLDYGTAERTIEALRHLGFGLAALAATEAPAGLDACVSCGMPVLELMPLIEHAPGCEVAEVRRLRALS